MITGTRGTSTPGIHVAYAEYATAWLQALQHVQEPGTPRQAQQPERESEPSRQVQDPTSLLFREQALRAYRRGDAIACVVKVVSPTTLTVLLVLLSLVVTALLIACLGHVDITARGPGILHAAGGVQHLATQVGGRVTSVRVRSGQPVSAGEPLFTLDATAIRSTLLEADSQLKLVDEQMSRLRSREKMFHNQALDELRAQAQLLQRRMAIQAQAKTRLSGALGRSQHLVQRGLLPRVSVEEAEAHLGEAEAELVRLEQQLRDLDKQEAGLKRERERELWRWEQERTKALDQKQRAEVLLEQTVIRAPQTGIIEALFVKPDDILQAGNPVGKLVPDGVPEQVTAFIAEKDRAFLQPGATIRLEIDRLPVAEFGGVRGIVQQVASDLASAHESQTILGDGVALRGPHLRVDIALDTTDPHLATLRPHLRSGTLLTAQFALRQRRVIALVFDPLRRWLEAL